MTVSRVSNRNRILDSNQIAQKLRRMAFEILEFNLDEQEIVLAGIYDKGYQIASRLKDEMLAVMPHKEITLAKIKIDKNNPILTDIRINIPDAELQQKCVVLVDDVLNSGRTMAYGMSVLLNAGLKKLQAATLVDRSHKCFPISANYKGFELSTTIDEHVEVVMGKKPGVYLY